MRRDVLTLALAGVLLAAALGASLPGSPATPAPSASASPARAAAHPPAHDHAHHPAAPAAPASEHAHEGAAMADSPDGHIPAQADAAKLPFQFQSFRAVTDKGLDEMAQKGYLAGAGTAADPYVIDGFRVRGNLEVLDTAKALVIRNSLVEGQLKLNYNGELVHVHHNRINDLRVNENVKRTQDTTSGVFDHNAIATIGQLRHFSGEFAFNKVGPKPGNSIASFLGDAGEQAIPAERVWNFDGYHLGWVHDNDVLGRVDVKLHGHYHGNGFDRAAHEHAAQHEAMDVDHTDRWHMLTFERNVIRVDQGDALRFDDEAHAGDDRTANSEPDPHLELAHSHHTLLRVLDNEVKGGPLRFDIVNANDERHKGHEQAAVLELEGNRVELPQGRSAAYVVNDAVGIALHARGNSYKFADAPKASPLPSLFPPQAKDSAGFLFQRAAGAAVIEGTQGAGATYGIVLARAEQVKLDQHDNAFHASKEVHHHG